MAASRFACLLLAILATAGVALANGAEPTAAEFAARYYATGLQEPLLQIRAGSQIVTTCQSRFRSKCSKRHREAAARAGLTLEYLDALTLFPGRPASDPTAPLGKYTQVVTALDETNEAILRDASNYDRALFARYGAALSACPPDNPNEYRAALLSLEHSHLRMFGVDSDDKRARALQSIADEEAALAKNFSDLTPEDCMAARQLGELLMTMISAKLVHWSVEATSSPNPDATRGIANEFLFQAATELELIVNPAKRERLETIALRMNEGKRAEPAPEKSGLSLHW